MVPTVNAQFKVRHITTESTKYGHMVAQFPLEVATEVRDIIMDPGAEPYTKLKKAIIQLMAESKNQCLKQSQRGGA